MPDTQKTMFKGMFATASGGGSWLAGHLSFLDPAMQTIAIWAGAIAAILTCISIGFDIRRKWKNRNQK